jgi:hypothetical protein
MSLMQLLEPAARKIGCRLAYLALASSGSTNKTYVFQKSVIRLSNLIPETIATFNNDPTATIGLTLAPQSSINSTETFSPFEILTPSPTSTEVLIATPTSLPTEIMDAKGATMMLVSGDGFTPYYMDKFEVTNALYEVCVNESVCVLPKNANRYMLEEYSNHPVVYVTYAMAESYCEWRNAKLPTGDDWMNALGAKNYAEYYGEIPWGDCKYANFSYGIGDGQLCIGSTTPVGSYEAGKSKFNIYDLVGNDSEWEQSLGPGYLRTHGGSWFDYRMSGDWLASTEANSSRVGFRCVANP